MASFLGRFCTRLFSTAHKSVLGRWLSAPVRRRYTTCSSSGWLRSSLATTPTTICCRRPTATTPRQPQLIDHMQFHFSAPRSAHFRGLQQLSCFLAYTSSDSQHPARLASVALRRDRDQQVGHKRVRHRHHLLDIQLLRSTAASVPNRSQTTSLSTKPKLPIRDEASGLTESATSCLSKPSNLEESMGRETVSPVSPP